MDRKRHKRHSTARLALILFLSLIPCLSPAQPSAQTPELETIFQSKPVGSVWGFAFIDQSAMLINIKSGSMLLYDIKKGTSKKIAIPKQDQIGQGGLLDVIYEPKTKYVFWTFSEARGEHVVTSLARGTYRDGDIKDIKVIFRSQVIGDGGRHFGSRLVIKDEYLYMTIGDRAERENSQLLSNHNGTILRLTYDGKPAPDNPFSKDPKALPEIFSYGHRNPQGIDLHPTNNEIYSIEYGPRGGDELNLIHAGKNYGWPVITYGKEYWGPEIGPTHKKGMEQPLIHWTPSISPSGMVFYRGDRIKAWQGNLFLAVLGKTHLRRLIMKDNKVLEQEVLFGNLGERIRQVRNGPDGYLYFSTDSGKIIRVLAAP